MSFGELRSLLQRAPSAERWRQLCHIFESFGADQFDDMIVPYVRSITRSWPRELCVAPQRWVLAELEGQVLPYWSVARVLSLSCSYLKPQQIKQLLSSDRLGFVEALHMDSNRGGASTAGLLASATSLTALEVLDLGYNELTPSSLEQLVQAPCLAKLRVLNLEGNAIRGGMGALSRAPWLDGLTSLDLRACGLNDADLVLFKQPMSSLQRLKLDRNSELGRKFFVALADAELGAMERLELFDTGLDNDTLRALIARPWWSTLTYLDIGNSAVNEEGVEAILDAGVERLSYLGLERLKVGWRTVEHLSNANPSMRMGLRGIWG